ncbi:MAG: hypothetical protein NC307_05390 [Roseburia sp.]|nr:hypothetical protein [Roseburia sp.]
MITERKCQYEREIFILEDDDEIRQMAAEYLESEGFLVDGFSNGSPTLTAFSLSN